MTEQPQQPQQPQQPPGQQYQQQYGGAAYGGGAQPMSPQDEKTWATLVHLAPFVAALVGIPLLGPLIVFLIFKDRGPFVRFHAAQALNFQIILTIALWVFGLLSFVLIGIPFLIAAVVAWVVFPIIGAVKANNGEWYRYPMTPELVK